MFQQAIEFIQSGGKAQEDVEVEECTHEEEANGKQTQSAAGSQAVKVDWWGIASSVARSVREQAADLVTNVQQTDWRAELNMFAQGVEKESHHLGKHTRHAVEQASEQLSHLATVGQSMYSEGKQMVQKAVDNIDKEIGSIIVAEKQSARGGKGAREGAQQPRYSRLDAEVAALQRDSSTYCDEPEDTEAYARWREQFDLAARQDEVHAIVSTYQLMAELQARVVPAIVEYDDFWCRYFFKYEQLVERHARLQEAAARAAAGHEDEDDEGWDDLEDLASPQPTSPSPPQKHATTTQIADAEARTPQEGAEAHAKPAQAGVQAAVADGAERKVESGRGTGDTAGDTVGDAPEAAVGSEPEPAGREGGVPGVAKGAGANGVDGEENSHGAAQEGDGDDDESFLGNDEELEGEPSGELDEFDEDWGEVGDDEE